MLMLVPGFVSSKWLHFVITKTKKEEKTFVSGTILDNDQPKIMGIISESIAYTPLYLYVSHGSLARLLIHDTLIFQAHDWDSKTFTIR